MSKTPRVDYLDDTDIPSYKIWDLARNLEIELAEAKTWHQHYRDEQVEKQKWKQAYIEKEKEVELMKQGKVFVDPKWIYDLETQLAQAHEELCQAGLREYGN